MLQVSVTAVDGETKRAESLGAVKLSVLYGGTAAVYLYNSFVCVRVEGPAPSPSYNNPRLRAMSAFSP